MQSGDMASRLRAVSSSVSPLLTLEVETLMLTASADKRFAAISNEVLVRVEGSKKRLITVRPRKRGHFLDFALGDVAKSLGRVQQMSYLASLQLADAE